MTTGKYNDNCNAILDILSQGDCTLAEATESLLSLRTQRADYFAMVQPAATPAIVSAPAQHQASRKVNHTHDDHDHQWGNRPYDHERDGE